MLDVKFKFSGFPANAQLMWACKDILGPVVELTWDFCPCGVTDEQGCLTKQYEHSKYGFYVYIVKDAKGHKLCVPVNYNSVHDSPMMLEGIIRAGQYDENGRLVAGGGGGRLEADLGTGQRLKAWDGADEQELLSSPWPQGMEGTWYLMGGPTVTFGPGPMFTADEGNGPVTLRFQSLNGKSYLASQGEVTCRFEVTRKSDGMILMTFVTQPFNLRRSFLGTRFRITNN